MKQYATTFVLTLIYSGALAQNHHRHTFFIQQDTAIQWAAECNKVINLSPKVQAHSLKKWYLDKIKKSTVTAYMIDEDRKGVTSFPFSLPSLERQEWLTGLQPELPSYKNLKEWYFVDPTKPSEDYDRIRYVVGGIQFSADSCCGCDETDAFRAKQVLHYKNGRFSIYNVFISPLCARKTANPPFEWYPLCNVAYNDNAERKFPGISKDVVLLNTDPLDYEFSHERSSPFDSVLTDYGCGIGSLIYLDMLKGNIRPVDPETGKAIPVKKILTWQMPADTMPSYNKSGEMTGYKVVQHQRNPGDFSKLRITQDFYFDFANERLYSVIRSVVIMLPVRSYDGSIRGYIPWCRLEQ